MSLLPDISQIPSDTLPLPGAMLDAFILPFEKDEIDPYTEYIPFGRVVGTKGYHALIYWKAGVMQYEFILATYTLEGEPLSHAIVGGIRYEDEGILHSVGVIHEDKSITIAEGMTTGDEDQKLSQDTQVYQMKILPTGIVTYEMNEENQEE